MAKQRKMKKKKKKKSTNLEEGIVRGKKIQRSDVLSNKKKHNHGAVEKIKP